MWTITNIIDSTFTLTRDDNVTIDVTVPTIETMNKFNILDYLRNACNRHDRAEVQVFTDLQSLIGKQL